MRFKSRISTILMALALVSCGVNINDNAQKPPESAPVVQAADVCIKSSDGTPITNSSGLCWTSNGVEISQVAKPVVLPATAPVPATEIPKPIEVQVAEAKKIISEQIAHTESVQLENKARKPVYKAKLKSTKVFPKVEHKVEPVKTKPTVDQILSQLHLASIAFYVPDKANIRDKLIADLEIDPTDGVKAFEHKLKVEGNITKDEILISKVLTAKLHAPNFNVIALTPQEQAISNTIPTKWSWELIPTEPGEHEVMLSISAKVKVDNEGTERYIGTYNKKVTIKISHFQAFKSWWNKNWQWVLSAIGIPTVIYAWRRRKTSAQVNGTNSTDK